MNIKKEIDKVLFATFYSLSVFLPLFIYPSLAGGYATPELFHFALFLGHIPVIYFIRKGIVYSFVFSLVVLSFIFSTWIVIGEDLWIRAQSNMYMDIWQLMTIIIIISIYFGFKLIIYEYIYYKNLNSEQKYIEKSLKRLLYRISFFFICAIFYIIAIITYNNTGIFIFWF